MASKDDDIQPMRDLWTSPVGKTAAESSSEPQIDPRNWRQELFASAEISAPEIRYKYHPERGDLLDRLRKANIRRHELLDHWENRRGGQLICPQSDDDPVFLHETSPCPLIRKSSVDSVLSSPCHYCARTIDKFRDDRSRMR